MPKSMDLTILQINDTHGYFELHNELFWAGDKPVHKKSGGARGTDRQNLDINAINALEQYLENNESVSTKLKRTIIPI